MKKAIVILIGVFAIGSITHAQSKTLMSCKAQTMSKDGANKVEAYLITVTEEDNKVKVKVAGHLEAFRTHNTALTSKDYLTNNTVITNINVHDFINGLVKSGNVTQESSQYGDGSLEITYDRSDCLVAKTDSKFIRCGKKDLSGTHFSSEQAIRTLVTDEQDIVSFTKQVISFTAVDLTTYKFLTHEPFSYYKCD